MSYAAPAPIAAIDLAGAQAAMAGGPPRFLGVRFDAQRRPVPCSGCTVVAHLDPGDHAPFAAVRDALVNADAADHWAWLPRSSYHMTVFDLLLHNRREPGFWPSGLAADASNAEADAFAFERLRHSGRSASPPFLMRVEGLAANAATAACISVRLAPVDAAENARMRHLRDGWADALGLRQRPGHEAYAFHVTLAYLVRWPDGGERSKAEAALTKASAELRSQKPILALTRCDACVFSCMTAFSPQFAA
ncbi:MAG: DUF1868 domain-containing protein [Pseudomonadota bacterium]